MRVCICGARTIGGFFAVQFHRAGTHGSVVARAEHLGAMRRSGPLLADRGGLRRDAGSAGTALR